ncbi:MAG: PH domain-containing protein [Phycisphaerales bacterium]|nr:PH domain-containing protein [Phycisphaerales bacterium]
MSNDASDVLLEARFDTDAIITYRWIGLLPICLFVVTIPFVIIAAIVYAFLLRQIVASWSATLTRRALIVRKGVFNKTEKTIPLEKITDLSTVEGPIMRFVGLKQLSVETAGQTGGAGAALVSLTGVVDTDGFRARVLAQRDLVSGIGAPAEVARPDRAETSTVAPSGELREIADTLRRIERVIDQLATRIDDRS